MFDLSENSCYLAVVRPPTKSIQHCTTGTCEIQRLSFNNDHTNLQYSIKHSKILHTYKKKYPFTTAYNPNQAKQLCTVKNITEQKSKFYVSKTLKQLHCTIYAITIVQSLRKQTYNSKNPAHEEKLMQIWQNLKPDEKLEARVTEQWISIGFQVNDPATDFRGAGFLGLYNLWSFTSGKRGKKVFSIASSPQTQYFFCSAGLFITMIAADLLKQRKVHYDFWVHNSDTELLQKFQLVYEMLFCQFSHYWMEFCPDKTIMYFNQNLKNFEKNVKLWTPKILRSFMEDLQD